MIRKVLNYVHRKTAPPPPALSWIEASGSQIEQIIKEKGEESTPLPPSYQTRETVEDLRPLLEVEEPHVQKVGENWKSAGTTKKLHLLAERMQKARGRPIVTINYATQENPDRTMTHVLDENGGLVPSKVSFDT